MSYIGRSHSMVCALMELLCYSETLVETMQRHRCRQFNVFIILLLHFHVNRSYAYAVVVVVVYNFERQII